MKAYENHVSANGQPASHSEAKEIAAGLAGAFIDREVESRGVSRQISRLRYCGMLTVYCNIYYYFYRLIDELLRQGEGEARGEEEAQPANRRPGLLSADTTKNIV